MAGAPKTVLTLPAGARPRSVFEDDVLNVDLDSPRGWPRLLSRKWAAAYFSCSTREIDRLIAIGAISVVRLPAVRHKNNAATTGTNRRILIDRLELDALCERNRERVGGSGGGLSGPRHRGPGRQ